MNNNYPSEEELKKIENFHGTPREFVEYVGSIWRNGGGWSLKKVDSEFGKDRDWLATFVTGGWSGCEEIIGVVGRTFFSLIFHSLWRRGGLFEYRIHLTQIDMEFDWGLWRKNDDT